MPCVIIESPPTSILITSSTLSWWDLPVAVTGLPNLTLSYKLASSPSSCLHCHTQHLTALTSTLYPHTLPAYGNECRWQKFFPAVKNSIMGHCLNCTSSQHSTSTGTEPVMDSYGFRVMYGGGEIPHDCMEPLSYSFHYSNKHMTEEAKLFNLSSYIKISNHAEHNSIQIYKTRGKIMLLYILIFQCNYTFLIKYCR